MVSDDDQRRSKAGTGVQHTLGTADVPEHQRATGGAFLGAHQYEASQDFSPQNPLDLCGAQSRIYH